MEKPDNQEKTLDKKKSAKKVAGHAKGIWGEIRHYVHDIFHIRDEVDMPGTIREIKKGLDFGGARAWVLMCAIFIASIGLNMGHMAIAVIIGAMLIAPLMAPILGAGVSLGTNDWNTLKKSTKSFIQAIAVSLFGSFVWFMVSPINAPSDALVVRTIPTLFDVVIAIFGGIACIITFSLKDKGLASTVIPGVAVGTSLMPPLCTAGYGIAHGDILFFAGGFYLFIINAVFIALSAYVYVNVMKFPKVHLADKKIEKRNNKYIIVSLLITIIPSVWVFIGVVKDSIFQSNTDQFVEEVIEYDGSDVIEYHSDRKENSIEVFMIGEVVPDNVQNAWRNSLAKYDLPGVDLKISQSKGAISEDHLSSEFIEQMYKDKDVQLHDRDEKIAFLENKLSKYRKYDIPLLEVEKEIKINYDQIKKLSYSESLVLNFDGKIDTIPTFTVKWEKGYERAGEDSEKLVKWLELRLDLDSPRIINY